MTIARGNLFANVPSPDGTEEFLPLWTVPGLLLQRIVSHGETTPAGEWYDQESDEWVLLVLGAAKLRIEGREDLLEMFPGDWVLLPAHCRHRVEWTLPNAPTIWLALHTEK